MGTPDKGSGNVNLHDPGRIPLRDIANNALREQNSSIYFPRPQGLAHRSCAAREVPPFQIDVLLGKKAFFLGEMPG